MACYNLVNCQDGITVMWVTDSILNPSLVIGQVISCNEVQGHCLTVTDNPVQPCIPTGVITGIFVWPGGCLECLAPLCTCPQGTTEITLPDGTRVCRQDTCSPALGPVAPVGCEMVAALIGTSGCASSTFCQQTSYNQFGAKFYQDIAPRPWPITPFVDPSCIVTNFYFKDNSAAVVNITNNSINTLWGDGSSTTSGRHNNTAVWNRFWNPSPPCPGNPIFGLFGFTHCLVVTTTTTYFFATSGRNFQLKVNGAVAINQTSGTTFGIDNLHVFPLTLFPGNYILEMSGAEYGGGPCSVGLFATFGFAWEIYTGPGLTSALLAAMTTTAQLSAVTIYSTLNEVTNKFDYGSSIWNHRCPQQGQALDNCFANPCNPNANSDIYVCHGYVDLPISGCCYLLTDCIDPNITYVTSTDLSLYIGQVINVQEYIGCFIVSQTPCGPVVPPTVTFIQSFGPASAGGCAACAPKCYLLTDCEGILPPIIVSDDLSLYVNSVIQVCPPAPAPRIINEVPQAIFCCYVLTDCCNAANQIKVQCPQSSGNGPAPSYLGMVITIPSLGTTCWKVDTGVIDCVTDFTNLPYVALFWPAEQIVVHPGGCSDCAPCGACTCYTVTLSPTCMGAVPLSGTITGSFITCIDCLPKCYLLVDCQDPNNTIITNTNLLAYVGLVIFIDGCPGVCWQVTTSPTCIGAVPVTFTTSFIDCNTCLNIPPPPPLELRPRSIKPGYTTPGCDPAYTEQVSCTFGNSAYDQMIITRYGITMCCNEPIQKWDIKKQLLDLRAIYDPELCKNTFDKCCPPCAMVATLVIFNTSTCDPPTGMISVLNIPPSQCPAPTRAQASITIP